MLQKYLLSIKELTFGSKPGDGEKKQRIALVRVAAGPQLFPFVPPFLSNVGPGASRGSSEERECVSRPLPGRDLPSEGTAARRVSVFSALQIRSLRVRVEPGLGLPALLSRLV